jgi:hypothetical protein
VTRSRATWREELTGKLRKPARSNGVTSSGLRRMLAVELGLFALAQAAPGESAGDGWALLFGYDVRRPGHSSAALLPGTSRWLIAELKSESDWTEALEAYRAIPGHLRLYDVPDPALPPALQVPSHAVNRAVDYAAALAHMPEHLVREVYPALAGVEYQLAGSGGRSVVIPPEAVPPPIAGHDLTRARKTLKFTFGGLEKTADSMDTVDQAAGRDCNWRGRIDDLKMHLRRRRGLRPARRLTLDDVVHLVGMPAVGKTTLITVLAVDASRRDHTMTIVLGDVVGVLNMVEELRRYDVSAAPILGTATRGRHLQQLHRPAERGAAGLGLLRDERLRWVSTACTVQGLMDLTEPLKLQDAPCSRGLHLAPGSGNAPGEPETFSCPLFYSCGRHEAARELVKARIWVATPPSLVHCRVPEQLSDASMRYLELAWMRSDAFVFDEADRVQIQLDQAFSPSQVLAGPSDQAWLDEVKPRFEAHIRRTHGKHLSASGLVRDWSMEIGAAGMLVARLRVLLANHAHVREWLRQDGYFNEWRLAVRLASEIARRPATGTQAGTDSWVTDDVCLKQWLETLREWFIKPSTRYRGNDARVAFLRDVAARGYDKPQDVTEDLSIFLGALPDVQAAHELDLDRLAVRFQVTAVIALLAEKLARLTEAWWEVENETGLESSSTSLVYKPPREYLALVPDSPMGNLLGFQYHEREDAPTDQIGTVSFFRCSGIGRWLMLNLPHLYQDGPGQGPGALLLSATSWAGNSPRYDVQVPVAGILTSECGDKVSLDDRIVMHYLPTKHTDSRGLARDIRVSGTFGETRSAALAALLSGLCKARAGLRGARLSQLEEIRESLDPGRQRLLLLVGSYREADEVYRTLLKMRPDWDGQILQMVPDDDSGTHYWSAGTIARGAISSLAKQDDVWLLIAPQLAIERGHNILNDLHIAALGATLYLVRPHLHPEDLNYHVQSMNRWAVEEIRAGMPSAGPPTMPLGQRAKLFRQLAHRRWLDQIEESLRYSQTEPDSPARRAMDWTNIAPLNQIIGRMLRGGATARVYFCDGAFAPTDTNGPLLGMYRALNHAVNGPESDIADPLYSPLHHALKKLLEKYRAHL